jgi:hypothetical protein
MYMCMCISITHSDATCMSSLMAVRTEGNMSQQYENGALFDTRTGALGWLLFTKLQPGHVLSHEGM